LPARTYGNADVKLGVAGLDLPANQIGGGLRNTLVWYVDDIHAGHVIEQRAGKIRRRTVT